MNIKIVSFISIVLLLLGIPTGLPYAFYTLLRWAISIFAVIVAYNFYKQEKPSWTWIFGGIAILFNPIAPIYLSKGTWVIFDIVTAALFLASIFSLKKND